MHLGASYFDDSRARERKVVEFLDSIKDSAREIFLLGDVLDYWFEYKYVVPRGYVRFFGKLAELTDSGVRITWIIGNHDIWIFDYIPRELGVEVIDGVLDREVMGVRMVMAHGDGLWSAKKHFKFLRALFRNRICQKLYSTIHPRWTVPFAYSWSRHSRHARTAELEAREEDRLKRKQRGDTLPENIEALKNFSQEYAATHPGCKYFLYGHLHQLLEERLEGGETMIVLGDWITHNSYAVFDGHDMRLFSRQQTIDSRQ